MVSLLSSGNWIFFCQSCGYFGGRGHEFPIGIRKKIGLIAVADKHSLNSQDCDINSLLQHLKKIPQHLLKLSPLRAEEVIMDMIRESLDCEIRKAGGVKDKGVDGYIVRNETISTIVQVKWHRSTQKAESVSVVREIAGTLLARGVPKAMLVTTRSSMSSYAQKEIKTLQKREIVGLGRLQIDVKVFRDIIAMLELAASKLGESEQSMETLLLAVANLDWDQDDGISKYRK